jgi:hypothetical protein
VKPVLNWIKANLVIVILTVLILLMLPGAWFASTWWDGKIRTAQEKEASDAFKKVQNLTVNYTLPTLDASAQPVSHKEVPNLNLIAWFKEKRDELTKQATAVVQKAEQFNQGIGPDAQSVGRTEHKPLVEGLFPSGDRSKVDEMEDALLGKSGKPNPYRDLLRWVRAGEPANAADLRQSLGDYYASEVEKVTAGKRELTPEEKERLTKQLMERRLGEYQARAATMSVYASMDALPNDPKEGRFVPQGDRIDQEYLNLHDLFMFQWDYWALRDVFAAVRLANTTDGRPVNVDKAAVKRIESITIDLPTAMPDLSERAARGGEPPAADPNAAAAAAAPGGLAARDYNRSITGRQAPNAVYDTRVVTLVAIVSSARLADFLSAIERTNFMTVSDVDLTEVKVWDDLSRGYFYGSEHVVRATIQIETVWLRSWMTKYMPKDTKSRLQIPEPAPTEGEGATPPPPGQG